MMLLDTPSSSSAPIRCTSSSSISVSEENVLLYGHHRLQSRPSQFKSKKSLKRVRIADKVTIAQDSNNDLTVDDGTESSSSSSSTWLSKAELRQQCIDAKRDVVYVQRNHPEYLEEFAKTFLACGNAKASLKDLMTKDATVQRLLQGRIRRFDEIRGLEFKGIKTKAAFSQYRRLHVQTVIQIQRQQKNNNARGGLSSQHGGGVDMSELLRSVSTKTSRPMRKLAQLLGRMDEIQLHEALKMELAARSA